MKLPLRSKEMTESLERSGNRALLHCVGLSKEDFEKPLVAVVNSWTDIVPGHIHLRKLSESVRQGITEAGGVAREFDTIAICDGICQGHEGMRYSLPSRDVIADSIELMIQAHRFDAMVMLCGCDKIVPGHIMAALRINIPTIIVTSGPMEAGNYKGYHNLTLTNLREFVGKVELGKMSKEELGTLEEHVLPGPGSCAFFGTANSMSALTECLGLSLPGSYSAPAISNERHAFARQAGRQIMELIQKDIKARDIVNRDALINAITAGMALGCSTNTVLHLMAIAKEADLDLDINLIDKISKSTPHICNVMPSGKYPAAELHKEGGIPAVLKVLEDKLLPNHMTVTGKTILENVKDVTQPEGELIKSLDNPLHKEGGIAILWGNLAPDSAVVKQSAVKPDMIRFKGAAKVYNSMEDAVRDVIDNRISEGTVIVIRYEGPKGGPGMREMHLITTLITGRGMEKVAIVTDGRFSGATKGPAIGHISPEAAAGGPIAAVEDGDIIEIDIPNRKLSLLVEEAVIEERLKHVVHPCKVSRGILAKYAQMVTSADKGAVFITPGV